jgi:hypothetical protein
MGFWWEICGQHNHDRNTPESDWVYVGAHNVYYVKWHLALIHAASPIIPMTTHPSQIL